MNNKIKGIDRNLTTSLRSSRMLMETHHLELQLEIKRNTTAKSNLSSLIPHHLSYLYAFIRNKKCTKILTTHYDFNPNLIPTTVILV